MKSFEVVNGSRWEECWQIGGYIWSRMKMIYIGEYNLNNVAAENPGGDSKTSSEQKIIKSRRFEHHRNQEPWNSDCEWVQVAFAWFRQKVDLTKYLEETVFNFDFAYDEDSRNEEVLISSARSMRLRCGHLSTPPFKVPRSHASPTGRPDPARPSPWTDFPPKESPDSTHSAHRTYLPILQMYLHSSSATLLPS